MTASDCIVAAQLLERAYTPDDHLQDRLHPYSESALELASFLRGEAEQIKLRATAGPGVAA